MRAALFDMDRTLIAGDSASAFALYQYQRGQADLCDLLRVGWWLGQYTLNLLDIEHVAERALMRFRGRTEDWMRRCCDEMFALHLAPRLREAGRRAIEHHRRQGEVVAIVTGAADYIARPVAQELGVDYVLGTQLELVDGVFTGRAVHPMCYGAGKIAHVSAMGRQLGFQIDQATFYSDSATDLPLLERVREPVAVNPDMHLRCVALRRRWQVQRW